MSIVFFVILVALVLFIHSRPDEFTVTRSAVFNTLPQTIFAQINNFRNWDAWSPWARLDPNAKNEFSGPAEGIDAKMAWSGNSSVGQGSMVITESVPYDKIAMQLEFIKPFKGTNQTLFTFQPDINGTRVTWVMTGQTNFITKAVGLFMNCEKMVGKNFEDGFKNLRAVVEK